MAATRRLVLTTAVAAAAVSLSACTAVIDGTAVAGDRGPCTHVDAPMLDVPASSSGLEPRMRIPEPAGWERDVEAEDDDPTIRLALSNTDGASESTVLVVITEVPDAQPSTIFDDFEVGLMEGLAQDGLPAEVTSTTNALCGLPAEMITWDAFSTGAMSTLAVVAESGGDTYLIAVVQAADPDNPTQIREAQTILEGFEVLPQDATAA